MIGIRLLSAAPRTQPPEPSRRAAGRRHWLAFALGLALLALAGAALPEAAADRLEWRAQRPHEAWRWLGAVAVHYSALHLAANLLGALGVGLLGRAGELPLRSTLAWLAAWPLTQLGLLVQPELTRYGGLSGVLHAGVAVAGVHLLCCRRGFQRTIGAALLGALALKIVLEAPWHAVLLRPEGWDIAIAPAAHASGAIAGLLCSIGAEALHAAVRRRGHVR